jgi:hypothetical protein
VRIVSRAPSRDSILLTAFDTAAFESRNSAVASAKQRHPAATLAKVASPQRLVMILNLETGSFDSFYF